MKSVLMFSVFAVVSVFSRVHAQHLPIYFGNSEISGSASFNSGRYDLNFRFAQYIQDLTQAGMYFEFQDNSFYTRTAIGAVFTRSFDTPTYFIPYVGATLGFGSLERGGEDNSGIELAFLVGVRYFLTNNMSLNSELHIGVSSDDTFLDGSGADSLGTGVRFGLSYSW